MNYDDGTGRRKFRFLRGRRPLPEVVPEPEDAVREAIIRVATAHPSWGPRQVYSMLRATRHDIPVAVVQSVLAGLQRSRPRRS